MIDNLFCLNICFVQLAPKNQKEKYKRNKIIIKKRRKRKQQTILLLPLDWLWESTLSCNVRRMIKPKTDEVMSIDQLAVRNVDLW